MVSVNLILKSINFGAATNANLMWVMSVLGEQLHKHAEHGTTFFELVVDFSAGMDETIIFLFILSIFN